MRHSPEFTGKVVEATSAAFIKLPSADDSGVRGAGAGAGAGFARIPSTNSKVAHAAAQTYAQTMSTPSRPILMYSVRCAFYTEVYTRGCYFVSRLGSS
jgi:hypothetical protein